MGEGSPKHHGSRRERSLLAVEGSTPFSQAFTYMEKYPLPFCVASGCCEGLCAQAQETWYLEGEGTELPGFGDASVTRRDAQSLVFFDYGVLHLSATPTEAGPLAVHSRQEGTRKTKPQLHPEKYPGGSTENPCLSCQPADMPHQGLADKPIKATITSPQSVSVTSRCCSRIMASVLAGAEFL